MKTENTETAAPAANPNKRKTIELQLRYDFTEKELLEKGRKIAELARELAQAEKEFDTAKDNFKSRIGSLEAQQNEVIGHVGCGYEHRFVECSVEFDKPKIGQKTTTRLDSNNVVRVEQMSPAELQHVLPLPDGATGVSADGNVRTKADGKA